jgi:hypothetical protein
MKAWGIMASVLATGALLAGCHSTVTGNPVPNAGSPTEPSFPTTRPSRSSTPPPTTSVPTATRSPNAAPPPGAEVLPPKDGGYVFIETKSGKTRCQINVTEVGCESAFTNAPEVNGMPANGIRLSAGGQVEWIVGNLGDIPVEAIDYGTYSAQGWTIVATASGTRFTNDATLHGMFLSTSGVEIY